jgi:ribosome biogenesis GTPase A
MAKTRRLIKESLSSVDIVVELLDARIPRSSKNPEIDSLVEAKPVLTVLNKASLADPAANARWKAIYEKEGKHLVLADCIDKKGITSVIDEIKLILAEKIERNISRGMTGKTVKAMVVGIPNVGKSSLINILAGQKKANVENRPGVTLNKQWIKTPHGIDLLDMPGVLWPKFEDKRVGENLAITGAIKDKVLQSDEIAMILCSRLQKKYPELLCARFSLDPEEIEGLDGYDIFEMIGRRRSLLQRGGEVDFNRCAAMLLDEFRSAKIGRITLE